MVILLFEHETLKVGRYCRITGCGDLSMSQDSKSGYDFCVEDYKSTNFYFTQEEMSEFFVSDYKYLKAHIRNKKIREILS